MTKCSYCKHDSVDPDDPVFGLCRECLTGHTQTWSRLDRMFLES